MSHESNHSPFLKLMKTDATEELIFGCKNAYVLMSVIAWRARRRDGFNRHNLQPGQALVGDHKSYDLTRQEYRLAMRFLEKHGFATFKGTSQGTIATIVDSRVFDINSDAKNHQINHQGTTEEPPRNHQGTTNEEGKKEKKGKKVRGKSPPEGDDAPGVKELIGLWKEAYEESFDLEYWVTKGKDHAAAKQLLAKGNPPRAIIEMASKAWHSPEKIGQFLHDQSKTISGFRSKINEIGPKLKQPNGHAKTWNGRPDIKPDYSKGW